jgi:OOP family OmpA-OmpF porin
MRAALAIACMIWAGACLAQETGFYIGAGVGNSSYREACADFNRLAGQADAFGCTSSEDTAQKAFAGWRLHQYLALEVSYIDFGEAKGSGTVAGAPVTATTKVKAAGLSALGILPLSERVSVYGRLGMLEVKTRTQIEGGMAAVEDDDETELHVGIGALFNLARDWGVRLEYERLNDTKIDLISIGVQYRF